MHIHLNIIVLSPLTWNIITSKDIFWGLCYHNHVRKPSIYSQQRSSFKRSKRRGQAWANLSAWGEGLLFMFPVGEITSPVESVVSRRKTEWLMRNLQQGRLFSLLQTLYHLSSINFLSLHPRWHDGTLFSHGRSYQAFYFGRTFKGNLGWPSMLFFNKINKSGWEKLADSLTAHRLETQSVHVRAKSSLAVGRIWSGVQATAEEWLIRCAFQLFTTRPVDLLCHRSNTQTILAGG